MNFILNTIGIATGVSIGIVIGCRIVAKHVHTHITRFLYGKFIAIHLPFGLSSVIKLEEGE